MSRSSLAKKLKPAKKAWKSFTNKLKSKLQKINITEAIKETTHRLLAFFTLHILVHFKQLSPTTKPSYHRRRHPQNYLYQYHHHHQNQLHNKFSAIYIDQLYGEPVSVQAKQFHAHGETSRGKQVVDDKSLPRKGEGKGGGDQSLYSIEDAWNAIVARSPQLRGVDERAEEFICKFRQDMNLQRERSNAEFQEMLASSA